MIPLYVACSRKVRSEKLGGAWHPVTARWVRDGIVDGRDSPRILNGMPFHLLRSLGWPGQRLTAVALLPLLLLVSLSGVGGWQCADGSPCRPAASLTCCCGAEAPPVDDCCLAERQGHGASRIAAACGCHFHAETADTLLKGVATLHLQLAPPSPVKLVLDRPGNVGERLLPPAITISPPRYLLSPTDGRAPPVA